MTYEEALKEGEEFLINANVPDPKLDAWLLFQSTLKIDRSFYYMNKDNQMYPQQYSDYKQVLEKRAERVPLQYITGEQGFMGMNFKVNSNVLIPRQDTETLVENALKYITPGMEVLDMCTGSGCIILSVLKNCPGIKATGVDISKQALLVAKENAKSHELEVELIRSNLFDNVPAKFDVILSNPPYIPTADIATLMPEVRDFEPIEALDGGVDGMDFYRNIISAATEHLKSGGKLLFEIGYDQGERTAAMMKAAGFVDVEVKKDLAGNDRVVIGHW